jgi:excisionase family DNA binding protein
MTEPLLIPMDAAAKVLGIGRPALLELVRAKRIRTVKVGRRVMFSRASLEAFAAGDEPGTEVFIG